MSNFRWMVSTSCMAIAFWGSFQAGRFDAMREANIRLEPLQQMLKYNEYCSDTMFKSGYECECVASMTHHRCAACDEIEKRRYARKDCQ